MLLIKAAYTYLLSTYLLNIYSRDAISPYLVDRSGVTRVGGDTRGRNSGCHPSILFLNLATFFSRQFCGVTAVYFLLKN